MVRQKRLLLYSQHTLTFHHGSSAAAVRVRTSGNHVLKFIITLFLDLPFLASAQPRIEFYSGLNFPSATVPFGEIGQTEGLRDWWHPAINAGIGVEVPVTDWFEVSPLVEYNHFLFDHYPKVTQVTNDGPPFFKSASGQVSRIYRLMLEARIGNHPSDRSRVYFVSGMGYTIEKMGSIKVTVTDVDGIESSSTLQISGKSYWAHSAGIGCQIVLSHSLAVDFCAKYYSNYKNRLDVSTNLGVVYALER